MWRTRPYLDINNYYQSIGLERSLVDILLSVNSLAFSRMPRGIQLRRRQPHPGTHALKECCCGCSIKTGCTIIAILGLLQGTGWLAINVVVLQHAYPNDGTMRRWEWNERITPLWLWDYDYGEFPFFQLSAPLQLIAHLPLLLGTL